MNGAGGIQHFLDQHWEQLLIPFCVLAVTLAVGYAAKRLLQRMLRGWAERSRGQTAPIVTNAVTGPFMIWVLILGVHLGLQASGLPEGATRWAAKVLLFLWILSLTIMGSRLAGNLIRFHGRNIAGALPVTTLTQTLAQLAVVIFGILVLLNGLGISITPILTALGVGGLAVALALQDTLSNLFAGFYVAVAGQVRLGDYIKLNTGEEGYVTDISWRSTTIRTLGYNLIIIPNNKLGQANVTNYHLPQRHMSASIQVNVAPDADADLVQRVLLEEAQSGVREIKGMIADPAPSVSFDPGFGDWWLGFTVGYYVAEFSDQFNVRQELRKRVLKRLRQERIGLPFPTRTVYLQDRGVS